MQKFVPGLTGRAATSTAAVRRWLRGGGACWLVVTNVRGLSLKPATPLASVKLPSETSLLLFPCPGLFQFGPGRDSSICSSACGPGYLLQWRSCVPAHPALTCKDAPLSELIVPGSTPCTGTSCQEQGNPLTPGYRHGPGGYSQWTYWSTCQADCLNHPEVGFITRNRTLLIDGSTDVQKIPCDANCPPG